MPYYISQTSMNPIVPHMLAALVAALALVGAFFFGLVVLALFVGMGLVFWLGSLAADVVAQTASAAANEATSDRAALERVK